MPLGFTAPEYQKLNPEFANFSSSSFAPVISPSYSTSDVWHTVEELQQQILGCAPFGRMMLCG